MSLLFSSLGRSVTSIVLPFCTLSQVAALMYISRSYFLELGLKPDLVCNPLLSKVLVA